MSIEKLVEQVHYCGLLMSKIDSHVLNREIKQEFTLYDLPQQLTKTAIKREITELRAALLELSKMVEV